MTAESSIQEISQKIFFIRGHKVMLDSDLARIYGVTTKQLNQAVKRNLSRFPVDFAFQLSEKEKDFLRSQIVTLESHKEHWRYLPYVFTEHGAVMLAAVLRSQIAVEASIQVVRAFIQLRYILASHEELRKKVEDLEKKYDSKFVLVFKLFDDLMNPPEPPKIGIISED